ncbi:MAG: NUC087 domain-containing protein [Olpidium bornovanus]|uniref:NUC087 domain-containing protein n=1 Tax=Olpidium bornovanus TaxID=278681 RepID=A0A8H8DKA7_9FUNG|nr:MAG: NUC087 domain-containing protein [Olpidium bornovanus]
MRPKLEKDIEAENGGAGVYNVDLKKKYLLANDEWKHDVIPEIWEGKNIADFIDPDIQEKLEQLDREEERLAAEGFYDSDPEEMLDSEEEELQAQAVKIRNKQALLVAEHRAKKGRNRPVLPKKVAVSRQRNVAEMADRLAELGVDASAAVASVGRKRGRFTAARGEDIARVEEGEDAENGAAPANKRPRSVSRARDVGGLRGEKVRKLHRVFFIRVEKTRGTGAGSCVVWPDFALLFPQRHR